MIWLEWRVTLRGFCDVFVLTLREQLWWLFTYWDYTPVAGFLGRDLRKSITGSLDRIDYPLLSGPYSRPVSLLVICQSMKQAEYEMTLPQFFEAGGLRQNEQMMPVKYSKSTVYHHSCRTWPRRDSIYQHCCCHVDRHQLSPIVYGYHLISVSWALRW